MNTENYNKARGEYLDFLMDKWVRAERGRTAAQALSVLGVSKTTWGKWKKGAAIRPANLNTLATFFDVTVDDIQTGGNSSDTEQTRQRLANAIQAIEIVESRLGLELSKKNGASYWNSTPP